MPLVDWNLKATWDFKYRIGVGSVEQGEQDVKLHYNRTVMFEAIRRDTNRIYAATDRRNKRHFIADPSGAQP